MSTLIFERFFGCRAISAERALRLSAFARLMRGNIEALTSGWTPAVETLGARSGFPIVIVGFNPNGILLPRSW